MDNAVIVQRFLKLAGFAEYNSDVVKSAGQNLADVLLSFLEYDLDVTGTLYSNYKGIGGAHFSELCFSWVASMDKNYDPNAQASFNNGSYRVIRINCAVDVDVYDQNGNKVASIVDEEPQSASGDVLIAAINADGEKLIYVPKTENYKVVITAREDETVDYGVYEYCGTARDYTRIVGYFDVSIDKSQQLVGLLPAYSTAEIQNDTPNGSSVQYTLTGPNGDIKKSYDLKGSTASNAWFTIEANPDDETAGVCLGSGHYQHGTYVMVQAVPAEGHEFVGWFIGNDLVSEEAEYRFRVTSNVNIVGRFKETEPQPTPKPIPKTGDNEPLLLWFVLIAAGLIVITLTLRRKKA